MMEWVLPTKTRQRFDALEKEFISRPDVLAFLRGGSWRGFFRKYPEANLLHKKMLRASAAVASIPTRRTSAEYAAQNQEARDRVLRGQGNDTYWHGVFGGIYAPHLRTEIWRNLIRAESLADQLTPGALMPRVELVDYDADGAAEILFSAPEFQALLKLSDGATVAFFDFRPASATLINSIIRRPEAYHSRLREAANAKPAEGGAVSIHDQVLVKEPNLERFLRYDRYPRHAFRLFLFDPAQTQVDYEELRLKEAGAAASGSYLLHASSANYADLQFACELPEYAAEGGQVPRLSVTKLFLFGPTPQGCELSCDISMTISAPLSRPLAMGLESVINFLAPADADRFFETPAGPQNLRFSGVLAAPLLRVEDGWQKVRVTLHAPGSQEFWVAPIETVSESEGGFERVYQGSQILAVWRPVFVQHTSFSARLLWRVESL
jgi:alpha-amylase